MTTLHDDSSLSPPPAKRPRTPFKTKSWKIYLAENSREGKIFGLQDLFAHDFDSANGAGSLGGGVNRSNGSRRRDYGAPPSHSNGHGSTALSENRGNRFYTLRLEHRQGGPMAQFRGEERILLFRSDRAGAIAKIIYSSSPPEQRGMESPTVSKTPSSNECDHAMEGQSNPPSLTAHAKIHVLDVKAQYRGRDLGGLLFSEAINSLKSKYCNADDGDGDNGDGGGSSNESVSSYGGEQKQVCDVECVLDAEEDISRHSKLVQFYEHLGCRVKSSNRVQYVNNNDSETYRKVPMQIDLHPPKATCPSKQERARQRRKKFSLLVSSKNPSFLPVQLVGSWGKLAVRSFGSDEKLKLDWLANESPEGIQFCTTHGHLLLATPSGSVSVLPPGDHDGDDESQLDIDTSELIKWTHFVPCHITDQDYSDDNGLNGESSRRKDLWVLRTYHGTFLTADSINHTLSCRALPSFWQADGANLSLVCTSDTPPRRNHYRKSWKFQTYEYVNSMRSKFLNFSLGKAKLIDALGWIQNFPANPFHAWSCDETPSDSSRSASPSLRTLCFIMAETAREEGLPDWIQLVALFHELGEAVKILDPTNTGEMAESIYDWTISSRSRVVGCKIPPRASFGEFRHLNMDEDDSRFNTELGVYQPHCGLNNVFLMWSGCEYIYYLLRHNGATIPEEGFAMIRYFPLGDWHEHHEYRALTNDDDVDMEPFVSEFDALRRRVRLNCVDCNDLSDEQCLHLWESHYSAIAAKYNCDHLFEW